MFGNRSLVKNDRNDRSFNPWFSDLVPRSTLRSALSPFTTLREDIMDLFDNFNLDTFNQGITSFTPRVEIKDEQDNYVICAEVPGMSQKEMNVSVEGNRLILEGEKKEEHRDEKKGKVHSEFSYGSFYRAIPLGDEVDAENITATYKDGVLRVAVKKLPMAQTNAKKIPISVDEKAALKH
jgi:HSP20 family protein